MVLGCRPDNSLMTGGWAARQGRYMLLQLRNKAK